MSEDEKKFETLGLKSWLVQQCKGLGMKQPTLVQSNCVPAIMEGNSLCYKCLKIKIFLYTSSGHHVLLRCVGSMKFQILFKVNLRKLKYPLT